MAYLKKLNFIIAWTTLSFLSACGGGGGGGDSAATAQATLQRIEVQADQTSLAAGLSTSIRAIGYFSDGTTADISTSSNSAAISGAGKRITNVTWTASPPLIGSIGANAAGPTLQTSKQGTVVVTAKDFFSGVSGSLSVTVTPSAPASLSVSGLSNAQTISARTKTQLTASIVNTDGSKSTAGSTVWGSSNPAVGTIDASGNFQGIGAGSVRITATSGAFSRSVDLTLLTPLATPLITISCNPSQPTTVNAQIWNSQYAADSNNATEWIAVDGASCQSYPVVLLLVPNGSLFSTRFSALRTTNTPTVFQPGLVYSGGTTAGQIVTIGQQNNLSDFNFTALYTLFAQ